MLYARWKEIVRQHHNQFALGDVGCGRRWTFAELDAAVTREGASDENVVFPQGISSDFILTLLRGWREGKVICPLDGGQARPDLHSLPPDCVHLKLTSATTGAARAVAFRPEHLVADFENIVQTMGLRPDWPNLGVISLAHSYGFSNLVLPLLLGGIPLAIAESPMPESVRRAALGFEHLTLPAVPALWRAWHQAGMIPANVRLAISAGAPLPLLLEQDVFAQTGIKLHNFYGSTECGGIAYDTSDCPRTDATCAGAPMKNVLLSVGPSGCLEVQGAAVGETYWPEVGEALGEGYFRTSDLVELKDGLVFLRGRVSDQINVAGRKISPETIERVLQGHPDVVDCLVFGVPTAEAERAEKIVACVVPRKASDGEVLKQFLLAKIPSWQVPRDWHFVDSLAVNQRGKLSRLEWRQRYLAQVT